MTATTETAAVYAGATATMGFGQVLDEAFMPPVFTFDVTCAGPDDSDREDYLHLIWLANLAFNSGDFARAAAIREEADSLVKTKWQETIHNTVMIAGKNDVINQYFKGSAYTAAWYMLLVGAGTIANTDTLASHPGWSEITAYAGNRPAVTFGTTSGGSNTATTVVFTLNASATIAGAGMASASSGTSGVLFNAASFASRSGASGDTVSVIPTVTLS